MLKRLFFISTLFCLFAARLFAQSESAEQMALQYLKNGETAKAIDIYEDLYKKNQTSYVYNSYLNALLSVPDYKEAEKLVKKQLKKATTDQRIKVDLAFVLKQSGDISKADKESQNIINELNSNEYNIRETALAFYERQMYTEAINTFLRGRILLNQSQIFSQDLSVLYEIQKNYEALMSEFLLFLTNNPNGMQYVQARLQSVFADEGEKNKADQLRKVLLKTIQKSPDNCNAVDLLIWMDVQERDFESAFAQSKAYEQRFKDDGYKVFELAGLALENKSYPIAEKAYKYLINKGTANPFYAQARSNLLTTYYKQITASVSVDKTALKNLEKGYEQWLSEIPKNANAVQPMRDLAHIYAFYSDSLDKAITLLEDILKMGGVHHVVLAQTKIDLADILLFAGEPWDATLLYSQVEKDFKNDETGSFAKFKNAKLSYYIGEFDWAKSQLDVLRSATAKLIANDAMELALLISENKDDDDSYAGLTLYAHADLLVYQNKLDEALNELDSVNSIANAEKLNDDVLYKKAQIKIKQGKYAEADSLLTIIFTQYSYDLLADDALLLDAQLNEQQLKNNFRAMDLYEKIIVDYSSSLHVVEARKRFRELRGDLVK